MPVMTTLSMARYFLPPRPKPATVTAVFRTGLKAALLCKFVVAVPAIVITKPLFSGLLAHFRGTPPRNLFGPRLFDRRRVPSF